MLKFIILPFLAFLVGCASQPPAPVEERFDWREIKPGIWEHTIGDTTTMARGINEGVEMYSETECPADSLLARAKLSILASARETTFEEVDCFDRRRKGVAKPFTDDFVRSLPQSLRSHFWLSPFY